MSEEQQQENKQKIRIGLIFGGRSGEHEVSLASANVELFCSDIIYCRSLPYCNGNPLTAKES